MNSKIQADNFILTIGSHNSGDLPPVLDIETLPNNQSRENWRKGIKNWIEIVENKFNIQPIIYSGEKFYTDYLMVDPYFRDYQRVWIAKYNILKKPNHNWTFWQFTDRVAIDGVDELVDMNVYKGSAQEFQLLLRN